MRGSVLVDYTSLIDSELDLLFKVGWLYCRDWEGTEPRVSAYENDLVPSDIYEGTTLLFKYSDKGMPYKLCWDNC
jgi:hypothetical protein